MTTRAATWPTTGSSRLLARGLGLLVLIVPVLVITTMVTNGSIAVDTVNYLAAGERLNAGHALYAVGPADRLPLMAENAGAPLLSPPLVAVLWKPLALLGDSSIRLWWLAMAILFVAILAVLIWRLPVQAGLTTLLLTLPITWQLAMGNVNALVVALLVAAWVWRDRAWSGIAIAIAAALKVVPIVFLLWTRQWRMTIAAGVAIGVLCLVGAGIANNLAYLDVARRAAPAELSLAGMAISAGLPSTLAGALPWIVLAVAGIAVVRLPERWGFAAAVVGMVLGSSAVNIHSFAMLTACLVPFAFPAETPE